MSQQALSRASLDNATLITRTNVEPATLRNRRGWAITLLTATSALLGICVPTYGDELPKFGMKVGRLNADRVLFLGNSITLHGPALKIGWEGNWGMAASAQDKDFAHLLLKQIAKVAGGMPQAKIKNIAELERQLDAFKIREGLKDELEFHADLVVVAIGENVSALKDDELKAKFKTTLTNLLKEVNKQGQPTVFVRSTFWADPVKDQIMKTVCAELGAVYVDNSKLSSVEANYARSERKFEHAGVAGHPGDQGMRAIADLLWAAILERSKR